MDVIQHSPYPHVTWLTQSIVVQWPRSFFVHECRHVTHHVVLTVTGEAVVSWSHRGAESTFHTRAGCLGFYPADREPHTLSITSGGPLMLSDVLIRQEHLAGIGPDRGADAPTALSPHPVFRDALIAASVERLTRSDAAGPVHNDPGDDVAARQIVGRLSALLGLPRPVWHPDPSIFDAAVMRRIVSQIDDSLSSPLTNEGLAVVAELSKGHAARKFKHSFGLSLDRVVNTRRIGRSLAMLTIGSTPLSQIALTLGFSSQSHFTRVFSDLTGMSPDYYRRQKR